MPSLIAFFIHICICGLRHRFCFISCIRLLHISSIEVYKDKNTFDAPFSLLYQCFHHKYRATMGDCVTSTVVQPCGALHTNVQVLPDEHFAFQRPPRMSRALEPSYVSTYQDVHKANFERLHGLVQTPGPCTFMHKDLTWAIQIHAKGFRDGPRTHAPVSIAYIPWVKVHDFEKGEETRIDGLCKFICQGSPSNQQGKLTFPRWNNYSTIMRCVCTM